MTCFQLPTGWCRSLVVSCGFLLGVTAQSGFAQQNNGRENPQTARIPTPVHSEHPLRPALELIYRTRENFTQVRDYSCVFTKRERIDGKLGDQEEMLMKVRNEPFSIYTRFQSPSSLKGREAIFVEGKNDGNVLAHGTGFQKLAAGTVSLDPKGSYAMKGNRYPITDAGLKNQIERIIREAEGDTRYGECDVQFFSGAKVDNRPCTCIQVTHPVPRKNFQYHIARVYIDDKWQIPVRSEVYDWPKRAGEQPGLVGEYTYTQIRFNQGFTDADFDVRNPRYDFGR